MKAATGLVALALAGCAPAPAPGGFAVLDNVADAMVEPATPERGVPMNGVAQGRCEAAAASRLVGTVVDATLRAEAKRLTGARTLRVVAPGAMVTMDYRADRLNIHTDAAIRVTRFSCG